MEPPVMTPPPYPPLSANDLVTAREVEPLPKGLARREYFRARHRMEFWHRLAANRSLDYFRALLHLSREPGSAKALIELEQMASHATRVYEDCIGHFNNAQADYRAVGGKV